MEHGQSTAPDARTETPLKTPFNTLSPGNLGVLLARAGVGKTACLTQIALEHLLGDHPVLHVCIDIVPDKVKVWYRELLKSMRPAADTKEQESLQHRIEPLRFILSYLNQTFSTEKLAQSLQNLRDQTGFKPSVVILDGLDFDRATRESIEALREFAVAQNVPMWLSAKTHRHIATANERSIPYPCHEIDDLFEDIVLLESHPAGIQVKLLKHQGHYNPESAAIMLNPHTFLIQS